MNIIDKIRSIKDLTYTGGCSEEQIKEAEYKLGLKFPTEYREVLKEFGCIDFGHTEWTGLNIDGELNVVTATLSEKELNEDFPNKKFVLENCCVDGWLMLVNEAGEVFTFNGCDAFKVCDSISDYLDMLLKGLGYYD